MKSSRFIISTLIIVVCISGITQGLTLPLLSILLDKHGLSPFLNGLNSTGLYLGIAIISPFLEAPLRRFGYRTLILTGLGLMAIAILLFPTQHAVLIWFILRFLLGIGDSALHYASQIWITTLAPKNSRSRVITLYGFSYGIGFTIGPLGIFLLPFGISVPFLICALFYLFTLVLVLYLQNDFPPVHQNEGRHGKKYGLTLSMGWLALLPAFLFGYLESSLNVNFPVYVLRTGIPIHYISILLPAFQIGALLLQLPLGYWSDKFSKKWVLTICAAIGGLSLFLIPMAGTRIGLMMILLAVAGGSVGSFYSMGMAFAADVLPMSLIPTAGVIMTVNYSAASILAPNLNGYILSAHSPHLMFTLTGCVLYAFMIGSFVYRRKLSGSA